MDTLQRALEALKTDVITIRQILNREPGQAASWATKEIDAMTQILDSEVSLGNPRATVLRTMNGFIKDVERRFRIDGSDVIDRTTGRPMTLIPDHPRVNHGSSEFNSSALAATMAGSPLVNHGSPEFNSSALVAHNQPELAELLVRITGNPNHHQQQQQQHNPTDLLRTVLMQQQQQQQQQQLAQQLGEQHRGLVLLAGALNNLSRTIESAIPAIRDAGIPMVPPSLAVQRAPSEDEAASDAEAPSDAEACNDADSKRKSKWKVRIGR